MKRFLNAVLQAELEPIRNRRKEYQKDIPYVYEILKKGSEYLYQEYSVNKASTSNQITAVPSINKPISFGNLLEGAVIYTAPYINNRTYLLIGKGNDLYYVDRTTIDRDEPIKLKTFDAEVTALNAETSQGNQDRKSVV